MSHFSCPKCGEHTSIFGHDGVKQTAQASPVTRPTIPIHPYHICTSSLISNSFTYTHTRFPFPYPDPYPYLRVQLLGLEVLADVPLHRDICSTSDAGTPIVVADKSSQSALVYRGLATRVMELLEKSAANSPQVKIVVE